MRKRKISMANEDKKLEKINKVNDKVKKYESVSKMKKRIKNSTYISNIKDVNNEGLLFLKTGEVACVLEVSAIDLSLTSNHEKNIFFQMYKAFYQIPKLNIRYYKLDEKLNLNENKINLETRMEIFKNDESKVRLLEGQLNKIQELEFENKTLASKYFLVIIAQDTITLNKQIDEVEQICMNINPRVNLKSVVNKLEIYKFLCNIYLSSNKLDELVWSDLPSLTSPINFSERIDRLIMDGKEIQMLTIKNIAPFIKELFFEQIFNYPGVRVSISIKDSLSQEELIKWVNAQYQFLLTDRNTTRKLSDATELDTQKENFQYLMQDIKNGNEKIKEVSLVIIVEGNKKYREQVIRDLRLIAETYQIKLDIPRCRQMEAWQVYDITNMSFKDYAFYLPTLTLSAGFPFTMTNFKKIFIQLYQFIMINMY